MPQPGLRERKKQRTRETILRAALPLFLERGFEAVSISEIAAAAEVSKMTVTNYFPAKEDMVVRSGVAAVPDLAGAVRRRAAGQPIADALRDHVRDGLERRAEWTHLHDGVTPYARMTLSSPSLMAAFTRVWSVVQSDLAQALAELDGVGTAPGWSPDDIAAIVREGAAPAARLRRIAAAISIQEVTARAAAAQVVAVVRVLAMTNLLRQAAGLGAARCADRALAETDAAFALLHAGLSSLDPALP